MATPRSIEIEVTSKCNLKCAYCSHFSSPGDVNKELSTNEWLQFFRELNECNVMNVTISGGEPFIREDITEIFEGIVQNRMRFGILSNGTLIDDDISNFLSSTGRCDYVQLSIDGSYPELHDRCRGEGSFKKAVEGLNSLRKNNIFVTVRVTIHKYNVRNLEEIVTFFFEDIGIPYLSTNSASYLGLCRSNADQLQLSTEERQLSIETMIMLNQKYKNRIKAEAGPLAEGMIWSKMEHARKEGKKCLPGGGYLLACGGVLKRLAIRSDGVIVPCNQLGHIELGRINRDNLREVWQSNSNLNSLRERRQISLDYFEYCRGCEYVNYCTGNCPALAYSILGNENHPSPDSCLKRFLETGGNIERIERLNIDV